MWLIFELAGRESGVRGLGLPRDHPGHDRRRRGRHLRGQRRPQARRAGRAAAALPAARLRRPLGPLSGPVRGRAGWRGGLSSLGDRARRGASGALYPQSATAGLNPRPRGRCEVHGLEQSGNDGEVPFGARPRTRSDPEGSSLKRSRVRAVGQPRRSKRLGADPHIALRRRVHGHIFLKRPPRARPLSPAAGARRA